MLQLLKESAASRHAERLEQIVIVLIAIEIGKSDRIYFDLLDLNFDSLQWLASLLF